MSKKAPELEIDVTEVVDHLRFTGGFASALAEVVKRKITAEAAKKQGTTVSDAELQKAADVFRVDRGLYKASDTDKWLRSNGLSVEGFEAYLETSLLINKFKDALVAKADLQKYLSSRVVKSVTREAVYEDWFAKAAK
jgi:hypothetical protein